MDLRPLVNSVVRILGGFPVDNIVVVFGLVFQPTGELDLEIFLLTFERDLEKWPLLPPSTVINRRGRLVTENLIPYI